VSSFPTRPGPACLVRSSPAPPGGLEPVHKRTVELSRLGRGRQMPFRSPKVSGKPGDGARFRGVWKNPFRRSRARWCVLVVGGP
jgi:hypothetical protein